MSLGTKCCSCTAAVPNCDTCTTQIPDPVTFAGAGWVSTYNGANPQTQEVVDWLISQMNRSWTMDAIVPANPCEGGDIISRGSPLWNPNSGVPQPIDKIEVSYDLRSDPQIFDNLDTPYAIHINKGWTVHLSSIIQTDANGNVIGQFFEVVSGSADVYQLRLTPGPCHSTQLLDELVNFRPIPIGRVLWDITNWTETMNP